MIKKIIKFILVILCMLVIFLFSSDNGTESSLKSDGIIVKISEILVGHRVSQNEREKYIEKYSFYIRKSAHFGIYLILGLLVLSLVSEYIPINYKALLLAFTISFIYACSDEVHQLFIPGRSGEVFDVFIDSIGSIIGIYLYYFVYLIWRMKYGQEKAIC